MLINDVRVLLFDMGGVLCRLNDPIETFSLDINHAEFGRRWLLSPSVRQYERGEIDTDAFAKSIVEEANLPYDGQEFLRRFDSWPRSLFPGTRELLLSISNQYKLAVLSNTNLLHWNRRDIGGQLQNLVDEVYLSCEIGCVKPDADAFEYVIDDLGCKAGEILFFDDNPLNISAAERTGCKAVLISEEKTLHQALTDCGILEPA